MTITTDIATRLKLVVLDVDGVMTDGAVTYCSDGHECKTFNIKDGLGIKMLQRAGIRVAIITGRQSTMVERRASELGIDDVIMGREDKLQALTEITERKGLSLGEVAYMGDDLPDLAAISRCGLGACPADAVAEVRQAADWIASNPGGQGAVREWADALLAARQQWHTITTPFAP